MIKILGCLLFVPILAQAQPVSYFDKNGKLFMQSNRVGNQVIYTDPVGRLVATQNSVATPVFIPPLTPNLAPPRGILVSTELPQLPQLPTLELLK
jgi:hypothetical protein